MDQQTAKFEGWAVVELFGHQREAGHVTTEYFGPAAMFRIDVPELPARDFILTRPEYHDVDAGCVMCPVGSKIQRAAVPGRTRFVSPSAIYALNPCTQDAAFAALERMIERTVKVIELAPQAKLSTGEPLPGEPLPGDDTDPPDPEDEEDDEQDFMAAEDEEKLDETIRTLHQMAGTTPAGESRAEFEHDRFGTAGPTA